MAKSSGSTRASASNNPRGLGASGFPQEVINNAAADLRASIETRRSAEDELRSRADDAIKTIRSMKAPKMDERSTVELPGGYRAQITLRKPGYGSGGILESEIFTPQGDRVGGIANHRERYGSNGMATFSSKSEAFRSVRDSMTDWIRIRFKGDRY